MNIYKLTSLRVAIAESFPAITLSDKVLESVNKYPNEIILQAVSDLVLLVTSINHPELPLSKQVSANLSDMILSNTELADVGCL